MGELAWVVVPAAFNKTWLEQKLHGMVTGGLHTIDDALGSGRVVSIVDPAACAPIDTMARASRATWRGHPAQRHKAREERPCPGERHRSWAMTRPRRRL